MTDEDQWRVSPGPEFQDAASADREIIDQLRRGGADLSIPRHVLFYLLFPSETLAADASAAVTSAADIDDFSVTAVSQTADASWLIRLEGEIVVNEEVIRRISNRLQAIAEANGGDYDGWEASSEP
jgi:hypothetical protein